MEDNAKATKIQGRGQNVASSLNTTALDDLTDFYRRYLILPENAPEVLALWTASTHVFEAAWFSPRLLIWSPTPESGKSRALEMLAELAAGGFKVDVATEAGLRRKVDAMSGKPFSLLIDEADTFFSDNHSIKGTLNAGWKRGARALQTRLNSKKQHEADEQTLWAPVAIAGIGTQWMWAALKTRSFLIRLQPKLPHERVENWDTDEAHKKAVRLRQRLATWAKTIVRALKDQPAMPKGLVNRGSDNWRLMLAIADAAGGHWPQTARRVAIAVSGGKGEAPDGVKLLMAIKALWEQRAEDWWWLAELENKLLADYPMGVARALRNFEIEAKDIKRNGLVRKGYRRGQFEEAWLRYGEVAGSV